MIKKFLNWFRKPQKTDQQTSKMVEGVLQKLVQTDKQEISCDDVHELIDQFSELKLAGQDVQHLMPLMQKHMELCPDCFEEHEALMEALRYEEKYQDELQ